VPDPLDPQAIFDLVELHLLGSHPTLTGQQVADEVGIPLELAKARWRSLGFTSVGDDVVAFTEADLRALKLTQRMHELGMIDPDDEAALIRTLGRSFARLAEWQITMLTRTIGSQPDLDLTSLAAVMNEVTPVIEDVQNYIWRRHTLSAASRLLLAPQSEGDEAEVSTAIGFADIVGYTRQTRSLTQGDLASLVEHFEAQAQAIITGHGGRIIKTIGDEILFAADAPGDAAAIALELVEEHVGDEDFPQLRVGVAWGPVLQRLGDVFGPTVNIASRLTSIARPGRVLIDKGMAESIEGNEEFKLRRMRRTSVKGYRRLEPWSLRRPLDEGDLPPVAAVLHERGQDLLRAVDELQSRGERTAAPETLE
jgi:adenylate cyclase